MRGLLIIILGLVLWFGGVIMIQDNLNAYIVCFIGGCLIGLGILKRAEE